MKAVGKITRERNNTKEGELYQKPSLFIVSFFNPSLHMFFSRVAVYCF